MNYRIKTLTLTLSLSLISLLLLTTEQKTNANTEESVKANLVYKEAIKNLKNKFYFRTNIDFNKLENKKVKNINDAHKEINVLIKELNDPYTKLLSKEEFKDELNLMRSSFVGIGIKLANVKPFITNVIEDSPAFKEGIQPQDLIVTVNEKDARNLTSIQVSNLLRGDKDSKVTLELQRGNKTLFKTIKREQLNLKNVSSKSLDGDITLIRIDSFIPQNTSSLFREELTKAMSKDIIIDLRNNTGGLFKNAVEIADMFLDNGQIVSTVTKTQKKDEIARPNNLSDSKNSNIIILVNENTASASEILVSALKENKRAIVIGKKTYGKGLIQEVIKLPDESALHITIAAYLTPSGKCINKIGITPDEVINNDKQQLVRAKEILESLNRKEIALGN
jgi:carboxyl-terminal processing protease